MKPRDPMAYPDAPVTVWPIGEPAPRPPVGLAGISVWVRNRALDPPYWGHARAVGVDDRPLWWGLGRMVAWVAPGEHLAEVRHDGVAESARTVRVEAGEVAELEFWTPASIGGAQGVLAPPPGRRTGSGWGMLPAGVLAIVLVTAVLGLTHPGGEAGPGYAVPFFVALLVAPVLAILAWSRITRARNHSYRVAVSAEAREPVRDVMFLGDGDAPEAGMLVVTGAVNARYLWNGHAGLGVPERDPHSWVPAPSLTIDGRAVPFGPRTWGYRLPPGPHTLTVTPRLPAPAAVEERYRYLPLPDLTPEITTTPATVRVDIAPGQIARVEVTVDATVTVRVIAESATSPTVLAGFTGKSTIKNR
ncbi:hypothetical protein ACIA8K_26455 [Catenuloplanes sp. NPDC051500]|uniref:hypothetical protein n=1 Tax=Catenuloplanes sp. NPDC051500 TaxID=3363959 RepID=UPI003795F285